MHVQGCQFNILYGHSLPVKLQEDLSSKKTVSYEYMYFIPMCTTSRMAYMIELRAVYRVCTIARSIGI